MSDNYTAQNRITKIVIFLSIIIAALSVYILVTVDLPNKPLAGQGGIEGNDANIGGEFVLTDHNGNEFNSDMMKGKLSLIYFGFTYCPDICPTSLQKLTQVLSTLDKYQIEVMPIFITIDPSRDKPALLKEYLGHFHPNLLGLTGSEEQIKEVADLYKVFYAKAEDDSTDKDKYMLDHTSFVYLMDKNGKYMKHFYMSSTPEEMIEYIRIHK
ncbi:MAG: SCO family protein [Rickettsiaceae bacterium]|nr:SCO family protein [Rickettsiaceae bacterium]